MSFFLVICNNSYKFIFENAITVSESYVRNRIQDMHIKHIHTQYIPDCAILLVECSDFTEEEKTYFENKCDYVLNLWHVNELHSCIFGTSKSLGEGTMTMKALQYITDNQIEYQNLFKICGRYCINSQFNYDAYAISDQVLFTKCIF